jgi:ketosteroid isomerase-like protein
MAFPSHPNIRITVSPLSADEIRAQVHRFWKAFSSKAAEVMGPMYFADARVFDARSARSEPASLVLAHRLRQFTDAKTSRCAEVGPIDVRIMGDVAIASYPYEFRRISTTDEGQLEIHVPFSCATQVFLRDRAGVLRIVHEHVAAAERGKKTLIATPGLSAAESPSPRAAASGGASNATTAGSLPATDIVFAEQIRSALKEFWELYRKKSKEGLEGMYSPTAILWAIGAKRGVPARLELAARERQLLGPQSSVSAQLGHVDVQTLSPNVAVASYDFHYCVVRVQAHGKRADTDAPFQGKRFEIDFSSARATHVFERGETGALQVAHEHLSSTGIPVYTELPLMNSEAAPTR